jgi:hypothetical protein
MEKSVKKVRFFHRFFEVCRIYIGQKSVYYYNCIPSRLPKSGLFNGTNFNSQAWSQDLLSESDGLDKIVILKKSKQPR